MRTLFLVGFLAGCPAVPTSTDSAADSGAVDADGDGTPAATDCDDQDNDVHPGADERCNGEDDDCNGTVDDNAVDAGTFWADTDGDNFGDAAAVKTACDAPSGYVADDSDCDDTRADVNPDATEVCDADDVDEDCDGLRGEADPSLSVASGVTAYVDADGDGVGDDTTATTLCTLKEGYSLVDGDCDDTDPARADYCYTTANGTFDVAAGTCLFSLAGTVGTPSSYCPDCDFSFDALGTLASGECVTDFDATIGYDDAGPLVSFVLFPSTYAVEIGPWPATLTVGATYDVLTFGGYGAYGTNYYSGSLALYEN